VTVRSIRALLFDLDGTLIDSREDLAASVNYALRAVGEPPQTRGAIVRHVGNGMRTLLANVLGKADEATLTDAISAFQDHYGAHCVDKTTTYPYVEETLKRVTEAGQKTAVVTNKPKGFADKILNALKLRPFIEVVVGGDTVSERKPHPAPLLEAVKDLGGAIGSTLIVGDGIQDIKAGQAAGIATCVARYGFGFTPEVLSLKPDFSISDFGKLKEIVL